MDDKATDIGVERGYDITEPITTSVHEKAATCEDVPPHPYQAVLDAFSPCAWQLKKRDPEPYPDLDGTTPMLVNNKEQLDLMMCKLKVVKELGVSVKRHSYRSFHGVGCLITISTRTEDFVVDTLVLKDKVKVLNEVFTDVGILKVMHKARQPIEMMQKDFSLFVLNVFDIHVAGRDISPNGPLLQITLPVLLKKHCSVEMLKDGDVNGDYRERPLTESRIKHARQESHYLLHIHDIFRNQLIDNNLIDHFYTTCTGLCKVMWYADKERFKPDSHTTFLSKLKHTLNRQQVECFRLLFEWRWRTAEANDEGFNYTLPYRSLVTLSKNIPQDAKGVKNCCSKTGLSPLVEADLDEVVKLCVKARKNVPDLPQWEQNVNVVDNKSVRNHAQSRKKMIHWGRGHHSRPPYSYNGHRGLGYRGRGPMGHPPLRPPVPYEVAYTHYWGTDPYYHNPYHNDGYW